jgi:hypothetical protein
VVQRTGGIDIAEIRERLNLRAGTRASRERPPLFSTLNLDPHYRPFRGLLFSVVGHGAICVLLAFIPLFVGLPEIEDFDNAVIVPVDELDDVLFLPLLGSNDLKPKPPASETKAPTIQRAKVGLSYPGPQPVLSDPPNATNHTQTLLQPALINPAILHSLTLPNIVRMAEVPRPVAPVVESRFKSVETSTPIAGPSTPMALLDVPLTSTLRAPVPPPVESRLRMVDATSPIAPLPTNTASPIDVSLDNKIPAPAPPERKTNSNQDLLALSPTPARADQPVVIPAGEMRGRFAISPTPNLSFPGTEPGINGEPKADENVPAIANTPAPIAADNAPKVSGTSNSPFAGITIVGGINGPGTLPNVNPQPLQTSYSITILSSGGSGGGLRDYGVFGNEQVQTVYLDMRRSVNERPVSWTVEYAVGQKDITPANGVLNISIRQEVLLPFPITKELPVWPEDLARKYAGRMVIAFALITTEGKIERPTIKESPDPLLNPAVITALEKWTFRAARRDGEIAPAKILLGIPVSLAE